jgi:hypothetical protein
MSSQTNSSTTTVNTSNTTSTTGTWYVCPTCKNNYCTCGIAPNPYFVPSTSPNTFPFPYQTQYTTFGAPEYVIAKLCSLYDVHSEKFLTAGAYLSFRESERNTEIKMVSGNIEQIMLPKKFGSYLGNSFIKNAKSTSDSSTFTLTDYSSSYLTTNFLQRLLCRLVYVVDNKEHTKFILLEGAQTCVVTDNVFVLTNVRILAIKDNLKVLDLVAEDNEFKKKHKLKI